MSTASDNRPLSPHLQVYRLPLAANLSILHRATGVFLSLGSAFLAVWLIALATDAETYASVDAVLKSWVGKLALFAWSYALMYHLCNGVRHLVWDTGRALTIEGVNTSGYIMLAASFALTAAVWAVACL